MKIAVALILAALSAQAIACREAKFDRDLQFKLSRTVVVARISGVTIPALEESRERGNDNKALIESVEGDRVLRLAVIETRKGKSPGILRVNWHSCGMGVGELGQRVVAYQSTKGDWYLESDPGGLYPSRREE